MKKESDFLIKNHLLYLYLSAHYTHCAVILYANIIKRMQITPRSWKRHTHLFD